MFLNKTKQSKTNRKSRMILTINIEGLYFIKWEWGGRGGGGSGVFAFVCVAVEGAGS